MSKPYLRGEQRGRWYGVVGLMKPNECIDVPKEEIARARSAMYECFDLGSACIRKLSDGDYRLWRLDIQPAQSTERKKNAHARQME